MNIVCQANGCVLVGKNCRETTTNGERKVYYSISVCQNEGEAGAFNVPKEIFDIVIANPEWLYKSVILEMTYRDSQKFGNYMSISNIYLADSEKVEKKVK